MIDPLLTARLQLTPLHPADGEHLHALFTDPEVRRYLWDDEVIPRERTVEILDRNVLQMAAERTGLWGIRRPGEGVLLGFAGFWHFRDPPELELIVGLHPSHWRRGYATEAGAAMIAYAFRMLELASVRASTDAANGASVALMERLGMRFERRAMVAGLDTLFYVIDRPDR